jgi:hypothetical protein
MGGSRRRICTSQFKLSKYIRSRINVLTASTVPKNISWKYNQISLAVWPRGVGDR